MGVTTNHIWDNNGNIVYEYGIKGETTYNRGLGGEIIKSAKGFGDNAARGHTSMMCDEPSIAIVGDVCNAVNMNTPTSVGTAGVATHAVCEWQ